MKKKQQHNLKYRPVPSTNAVFYFCKIRSNCLGEDTITRKRDGRSDVRTD